MSSDRIRADRLHVWDETVHRLAQRHGSRLDLSRISDQFLPYFHGPRIRVDFGEGIVKAGTVGITGGWQPSLLLMLNRNSMGSQWLLNDGCRIVAVQRGRKYVEVAP